MIKRINSVYEPAKTKIGVLLLACALCMTLLAGISIAADTGEVKITLPENPVRFNEALDSYLVTWEKLDGVKEYHIGVYYKLEFVSELQSGEFWRVGGGYIGQGIVTDNAGNEYWVEKGCFNAVTLAGDASEVDLSEMINTHMDPVGVEYDPATSKPTKFAETKALLNCNMLMTVVREAGEPFVLDIEIPVDLEGQPYFKF